MSAETCIIIVSAALLFAIRGGVRIVSYALDRLPSSRIADLPTFSGGA
jgi:hypothetical protein